MSNGEAVDRGQNGGQRPNALEDVAFPVSMRGYDREAVDSYVSRVREVVAQLEASRSPEAAVKDALEKVGEQTKSVLESAGQSAEEITAAARREAEETTVRAQSEAEEVVAKAKAEASEIVDGANAKAKETVAKARKEAAEHLQRTQEEVTALREEAEARLGELSADTENIRQDRGELVDEIREFAVRVEEVARAADARFPQREAGETATEDRRESEAAEQADAAAVAVTDKSAE
jgi:DivIVA domain-containing protein